MAKQRDEPVWLCLRFTHLALNCVDLQANSEALTVVVEQQQVFQCTNFAQQSGLQTGISVNHALMLNPAATMLDRNPKDEARKLAQLSYWAYRFTSQVSVYKSDTLLLEIGKSINLFNSLNHLLNLINNDLESFGMDTMHGIGHTPKAAYVLSFSAPTPAPQAPANTLDSLLASSISHLDIQAKTLHQLLHCGFEQLADLQAIPGNELGRRFGADFLLYLDQLWGRVADPQTTVTPPETFAACADFAEPIANVTWINQQIDRLLGDLVHFITCRQLICRSFTWRFYHENNRLLHTATIGLSARQNNLATLRELSDLKLAGLKLKWEFASIELSSTQLVPRTLFSDDLFDPQPDKEQFNQLIDKLTSRLGQHALFRVHAAPEHLPELANDRRPAEQEIQEPAAHYEVNNTLKDQPLWLLENPQRLPQHHSQSQAINSQRGYPLLNGPLTIIHGPDRITSHWWSKLESRDYFIARQRNGRLLWLFFDRATRDWFLHGLFA